MLCRSFDDSFTGEEAVDVLVAFHASDGPGFAYHATDRAAAVVDFGGDASAASEDLCDESETEVSVEWPYCEHWHLAVPLTSLHWFFCSC